MTGTAAPQTTVRRHPERASYDRDTIDPILDEGLVGHLGFTSGGAPYVIPMLYARAGETLYLHGAPASRLLGTLAEGARACFTVTLLDGLVLARSAFHHSLNYRSVVVIGDARAVTDPDEKLAALEALVEHVLPGRTADARGPSRAELKVTEVIALDLDQAAAKVRTGPPIDTRADMSLPVWAGELPLELLAGDPVPDPHCSVPEPSGLRSYRRGRGQRPGEVGGRLVAALSLADGSVIADPFEHSLALVDLLRARARQLTTSSAPKRPLRSIRAAFRARLRLQPHR